MGTRTVRLDEQTEQTLYKLRKSTGLSISEVLKRGVQAYAAHTVREAQASPYEVFRQIDLGAGGTSKAAGRNAKTALRAAIARKHGR